MGPVADDDVVTELEQVVIHDREAVHVHAASHAGAVQSVVCRPDWCPTEQCSGAESNDMEGGQVARPLE
jgi:hypothetical protein